MNRIFLSIGSNIGDKLKNIETAICNINNTNNISILLESSIYKTSPMYNYDQPYFFNKVIEISTKLDPYELLKIIKSIELSMGRNIKNSHNFPRVIDVDILVFRNLNISSEELTIPHPRITERRFVLEPWREISPNYKMINQSLTIGKLYKKCLAGDFKNQKVELIEN